MDKTNLPPLPPSFARVCADGYWLLREKGTERFDAHDSRYTPAQEVYTAEQMHEYAAHAVREAVPDAATLQGIPVVTTPAMPADTWVVVPRRPTAEMLAAPNTVIHAYGARLVWDRMIEAAPTQD